ncbi:MAG: hypothetical protein IT352_14515 [Gemmatimonadales bacterium]|nr:hypothetical protein [Gemmatimonadales bacterium]
MDAARWQRLCARLGRDLVIVATPARRWLATLVPAVRAARIDPGTAVRSGDDPTA